MSTSSPSDPRYQLQIEYLPTTSLVLNPNNARHHSESQVRKLGASMLRSGCPNPVLIDNNNVAWCGNGRVMAALRVGISHLPVIRLSHMSEADLRAYALADNRIAQDSSWSRKMLKAELQGLAELGYELELSGFTTLEIDTVLSLGEDEPASSQDDIVELPDETPPISRIGDLWHIGDHRLVCGDARMPFVYERLLQGERIQMVFVDPPYGVKIQNNVSGRGRFKHLDFVMGADGVADSEFAMELLRPAFRCIAAHALPGCIAFCCMDWRGGPKLLDAAQGIFHELKNLVIWVKSNAALGSFYRNQYEMVYVFKVSPGQHINNFGLGEGGRHRSNVWQYPGANVFRKGRMEDLADHPTVKPKNLVADALLDCSKRGGIVLDSFAGSGTTLIACEMTGRKGRGIELDPKYCDVILRRLQKETGKVALLDGEVPFDQVAAQRQAAA
jgi:DNA modification methylase